MESKKAQISKVSQLSEYPADACQNLLPERSTLNPDQLAVFEQLITPDSLTRIFHKLPRISRRHLPH